MDRFSSSMQRLVVILGICVCLLMPSALYGDDPIREVDKEIEVIPGYLRSFLTNVTWPSKESADDVPYRICIVGGTSLAELTRTAFVGKSIGRRTIQIAERSLEANFGDCDLIFLGVSPPAEQLALIEKCAGLPLLLVSPSPGFAARGGGLELRKATVSERRERRRRDEPIRWVYVLNDAAFRVQKLVPSPALWANAAEKISGPAVEPRTTPTAPPSPAPVASASKGAQP